MFDLLWRSTYLHDLHNASDISSSANEQEVSSDKDLSSQDLIKVRQVSMDRLEALQRSQQRSTRTLNSTLLANFFSGIKVSSFSKNSFAS